MRNANLGPHIWVLVIVPEALGQTTVFNAADIPLPARQVRQLLHLLRFNALQAEEKSKDRPRIPRRYLVKDHGLASNSRLSPQASIFWESSVRTTVHAWRVYAVLRLHGSFSRPIADIQ